MKGTSDGSDTPRRTALVVGLFLTAATLLCGVFSIIWEADAKVRGFDLTLANGLFVVGWVSPAGATSGPDSIKVEKNRGPGLLLWPRGPGLYNEVGNQGIMFRFVFLPLWLPLVPGAVLTAFGLIRSRRGPRCCVQCGYDLAGTPAPRCPDCGADVKPREIA